MATAEVTAGRCSIPVPISLLRESQQRAASAAGAPQQGHAHDAAGMCLRRTRSGSPTVISPVSAPFQLAMHPSGKRLPVSGGRLLAAKPSGPYTPPADPFASSATYSTANLSRHSTPAGPKYSPGSRSAGSSPMPNSSSATSRSIPTVRPTSQGPAASPMGPALQALSLDSGGCNANVIPASPHSQQTYSHVQQQPSQCQQPSQDEATMDLIIKVCVLMYDTNTKGHTFSLMLHQQVACSVAGSEQQISARSACMVITEH